MKLKRRCAVCRKRLSISVSKDKGYIGGHYYGKTRIPYGKGEWVKIRTSKLLGRKVNIVNWTGKKKEVEHWECEKCNSEED